MDDKGNTRINFIWDQTIDTNVTKGSRVPFGELYISDDINKAIAAKRNGENPYDIVPSKDVVGHGTSMAGIVGARGKNHEIKGIAPECEFVIVKLSESAYTKKLLNLEIPIFSLPTIFAAIEYLKKVLFKEKKKEEKFLSAEVNFKTSVLSLIFLLENYNYFLFFSTIFKKYSCNVVSSVNSG